MKPEDLCGLCRETLLPSPVLLIGHFKCNYSPASIGRFRLWSGSRYRQQYLHDVLVIFQT
jgi:hypothetical protein